ncbi:MAG: hypothetical protein CME61_00690 [Halobacteriovoraceae bacterium]|nr:hypothetical protein [Halobacteriovoraceae bacterium]|tara:strand:+ start:460 stop:975 length:516 start_codon:yes stop_codon:yes gene_type:complete
MIELFKSLLKYATSRDMIQPILIAFVFGAVSITTLRNYLVTQVEKPLMVISKKIEHIDQGFNNGLASLRLRQDRMEKNFIESRLFTLELLLDRVNYDTSSLNGYDVLASDYLCNEVLPTSSFFLHLSSERKDKVKRMCGVTGEMAEFLKQERAIGKEPSLTRVTHRKYSSK